MFSDLEKFALGVWGFFGTISLLFGDALVGLLEIFICYLLYRTYRAEHALKERDRDR